MQKFFSRPRHTYPAYRSSIFVTRKSPRKVNFFKDTIKVILVERKSPGEKLFKDLKWLGGVYYLSRIFKELDRLKVLMQGKGGDIFLFNGKTTAMK